MFLEELVLGNYNFIILLTYNCVSILIKFFFYNRDMLVSESVLRELYPNDLGIESPNPANHYQLARHNLGLFSTLGLGIPYRWAQRMAGLHFISANPHDQKVNSFY